MENVDEIVFGEIEQKFIRTLEECHEENYKAAHVIYAGLRILGATALVMAPNDEAANELIKMALADSGEFVW